MSLVAMLGEDEAESAIVVQQVLKHVETMIDPETATAADNDHTAMSAKMTITMVLLFPRVGA